VVAACHGNAFPMGAFLIMSCDHRIAAEGNYRIGMNEVAIGLTVPRFAIEIARQRLTPAYFSRVVMTAEMFAPWKRSPPASSIASSPQASWNTPPRRQPGQ
jgi:enoyl-CoA hydratase